MRVDSDWLDYNKLPEFLERTQLLIDYIKGLTPDEAKKMWKCNDDIVKLNYQRFKDMKLKENLTPAILSYEGIQYKYMAPSVFTDKELSYIADHLRILSGFYGVLRPLDGVAPYRLEMQAIMEKMSPKSLYSFWGDSLAKNLVSDSNTTVNLASKEYSKAIEPFLPSDVRFISCTFGELKGDKTVSKATQVKIASGEMVRFMAEQGITDISDFQKFDRQGFAFSATLSDAHKSLFLY